MEFLIYLVGFLDIVGFLEFTLPCSWFEEKNYKQKRVILNHSYKLYFTDDHLLFSVCVLI